MSDRQLFMKNNECISSCWQWRLNSWSIEYGLHVEWTGVDSLESQWYY